MEVTQFVMQYKARVKNKELSQEEDIKLISDMLHTKKYIGISKKKSIVQNIIKSTVTQDDYLDIKYDGCDKYLYTIITLINEYTDLNIDEKGYDQICSNELLNKVVATFGVEYEIIMGIMNEYMEQLVLKQIDIRGW